MGVQLIFVIRHGMMKQNDTEEEIGMAAFVLITKSCLWLFNKHVHADNVVLNHQHV